MTKRRLLWFSKMTRVGTRWFWLNYDVWRLATATTRRHGDGWLRDDARTRPCPPMALLLLSFFVFVLLFLATKLMWTATTLMMKMTTTRRRTDDGDEAPEASTAYHSTVLVLRVHVGAAALGRSRLGVSSRGRGEQEIHTCIVVMEAAGDYTFNKNHVFRRRELMEPRPSKTRRHWLNTRKSDKTTTFVPRASPPSRGRPQQEVRPAPWRGAPGLGPAAW